MYHWVNFIVSSKTAWPLLGTLVLVVLGIKYIVLPTLDRVFNRLEALQENQRRLECEIRKFEATIDGLYNPTGRPVELHSEESVRRILSYYAGQIVVGERKLDEVRRQEHRDIDKMADLCNWILKRRDQLAHAERCAKSLGLEFNRADLFKEAAN